MHPQPVSGKSCALIGRVNCVKDRAMARELERVSANAAPDLKYALASPQRKLSELFDVRLGPITARLKLFTPLTRASQPRAQVNVAWLAVPITAKLIGSCRGHITTTLSSRPVKDGSWAPRFPRSAWASIKF